MGHLFLLIFIPTVGIVKRNYIMKQNKLFSKDFTMVVIGQIISLFGNAILRYALPLYLLNRTHSAVLFGTVSACSFIPMILFAPIGGIVADRVNKRNIMVALDFSTAVIVTIYAVIMGSISLVVPIVIVLMLLYGIQGAYQPSVQASLPVLVSTENLNSANAIINMVSSLSGLIGPVLGGVIYATFGICPILYISAICFFCSAVMEIFIHIPFNLQSKKQGILTTAYSDMKDSLHFIIHRNPIIGKVGVLLSLINLIFSALIIIAVPVIITEHLSFSEADGNRLYGYAEGALALGGLIGGLIASILGAKLKIRKSWQMVLICSLTLVPITLATTFTYSKLLSYIVIVASCFIMMIFSTIFSVEMLSYGQKVTPKNILGKVMAMMTCMCLCASPIGQAAYGFLFDRLKNEMYIIFIAAFIICLILTLIARKIINQIKNV